MSDGYKVVFEVTYLGYTNLVRSLLILCASILGLVVLEIIGRAVFRAQASHPNSGVSAVFKRFCVGVWVVAGLSTIWLISNIYNASESIRALRSGRCSVVEGTVHVLHKEAWGGHGSDNIRIGDKEFAYSFYGDNPGYHQTISHWGALTDETSARLHYFGYRILKVEVKQP
jgi:hypothetical protein